MQKGGLGQGPGGWTKGDSMSYNTNMIWFCNVI